MGQRILATKVTSDKTWFFLNKKHKLRTYMNTKMDSLTIDGEGTELSVMEDYQG
jgi:hypothetical protein